MWGGGGWSSRRHRWVGGLGWTRSVSTPPPSGMGTGSPFCTICAKGAPLGGMARNGCDPKFSGGTPYGPIHVGREDSGGSPSVRAPDWRLGGAQHLATKIFPGVPPYFPLVIFLGP